MKTGADSEAQESKYFRFDERHHFDEESKQVFLYFSLTIMPYFQRALADEVGDLEEFNDKPHLKKLLEEIVKH